MGRNLEGLMLKPMAQYIWEEDGVNGQPPYAAVLRGWLWTHGDADLIGDSDVGFRGVWTVLN